MGSSRCHWVRDRLPLRAGGELAGAERRRVERHLIGCPACRSHGHGLDEALEALRAAAAAPPTSPTVPSLWPALARQIRESRRPAPASGFTWPSFAQVPALRPRFWPTFGLTLSLLAALGTTAAIRQQASATRARIRAAQRPLAPPVLRTLPPAPLPAPSPKLMVRNEPVSESAPVARYDYDLEHGTPMGPDIADGKSPTKSATY